MADPREAFDLWRFMAQQAGVSERLAHLVGTQAYLEKVAEGKGERAEAARNILDNIIPKSTEGVKQNE